MAISSPQVLLRKLLCRLLLPPLLAVCVAELRGATIIGNIPSQFGRSDVANVRSVGYGFVMGSSDWQLTRTTFITTEKNLTYSLAVYSDNGGLPGSLEPVTFPTFTDAVSLPNFQPSSPFLLRANTMYWFVLSGASNFTAEGTNLSPSGQAATFAGYTLSTSSVVPDSPLSGGLIPPQPSFLIEGLPVVFPSAVPEPGSVLLSLSGGAIIWLLRRRSAG